MSKDAAKDGKSLQDIQKELSALTPRYQLVKIIGQGSYGIVIKARDTVANVDVAIKRVNSEILEELILAKRILREVHLLHHFHDDNIIGLRDIWIPRGTFDVFYIVMELMETDLKQVLKSGQKLTDAHVQFFTYQALRALRVIHTANVLHRDVTPANILVNSNCDLKLCDFGLAKEESDDTTDMTDYVTMRWYRAPELVMEHRQYTSQIDVWGVGLILAELLGSRPLCQGRDRVNQLDRIIDVTGTPTEADLTDVGSAAAQRYLRRKTAKSGLNFAEKFPHASPAAIDLLQAMLRFHPKDRITVEAAMRHPYLADFYDAVDEKIASPPFTLDDSALRTVEDVKRAMVTFSETFHSKRRPSKSTLNVAVDGEGRCSGNAMNAISPDQGRYEDV